jgi:carboxymethylenebutenolidase
MEIRSERVEIPVSDGTDMGGYVSRPEASGVHPGVVVFMEIFGVNPHIRDVADRVAREGYVALAPDFFHRSLPGVELGYDDAGMAEGMKGLGALDADEMVAGAMGFCIGGHMTYLAACEADVAAAASFYGGGIASPEGFGKKPSTVSRTPKIRGRILCLFGADDALIPKEQVETIRRALSDAGTRHEVVIYDGANHGFFCDRRATYHEASARDAWQRVKRLFGEELRG